MICYVTGLFALYWKRSKFQAVFLLLLSGIVIANLVLAIVFKREENVSYLLMAIFLMLLNGFLIIRAVHVYKKMKGKIFIII